MCLKGDSMKKIQASSVQRILQKIINLALQIILDEIGLFSLKVAGYNYISKPLYHVFFYYIFPNLKW